ncbi:MAG: hypothetical protein Q4A21_03430 [bacterium]|nr:hypothetical protein [bacterium]
MDILRKIIISVSLLITALASIYILKDNYRSLWFWLFFGILSGILGVVLFVDKNKFKNISRKNIFVTSILVLLVIQAIVAYATFSKSGWDIATVRNIVNYYIENNKDIEYKSYLTRYDNNTPIAMFLLIIYKIAGVLNIDGFTLSSIVNALMMISGTIAVLWVVYRRFNLRVYVCVWILSVILVGLSPYISQFYTDSVGFFGVSIIILSADFLTRKKNYLSALLLGIAIIFSFYMKATSFILVLAVFATLFLSFSKQYINKKSILIGLSILMGVFSGVIVNVILRSKFSELKYQDKNMIDRYAFDASHFLALGSLRGGNKYDKCRNGEYCHEYVVDMISDGLKSSRFEKNIKVFKDSLRRDFPVGYLGFAIDKIGRAFSKGSFLIWWDGESNKLNFLNQDKASRFIRRFLAVENNFEPTAGRYFDKINYLWNATWFIVVVLITVGSYRGFKNANKYNIIIVTILSVAIVGIAMYQGLFESRARYLFLYLPFFMLMAGYGLDGLIKRSKNV